MTQPYIPATNVAQIDAVYEIGTNVMENVYHVLGAAPWTRDSLTNLAAYVVAWETDHGSLYRSHQVGLVRVSCTDLTTQTSPRVDLTAGLPVNGQVLANMYPSNVTIALKKVTGSRGRSFRGRTYWIGLWEDVITVDLVAGPTVGNIVAAMEVFRANLASQNGGQLVVLSKRHNGAWRTAAVATPVIQYIAIDLIADSQRRRLAGHNVHR